jgi:pimeloyl-ACP methyl ester carboxylesterase
MAVGRRGIEMLARNRSKPAMAPANGLELCYDTFGEPDASPLVLIMGLAAQMIAWDEEFCGLLASRGYWVIRFDNRDVGLSTKFTERGVPNVLALLAGHGGAEAVPYSLRDMADDTAGLMDALGIRSAHVVGASMGGAIAQELAIRHPGRLRTLTSIMSSTGEPGLPPPTPQAMEILLAPTPTDRDSYLARYRQTWRVLRAGEFPLDEARDTARAGETFDRGLNPAGVARQLAAIVASGSRKDALRAVRVPALVIHGDADPLVPLAGGIATADAIAGARLVVMKGMGHALPIPMWPQIIEAIASHAR